MHEASLNQIIAAAPDASTWLSANAGSGKTRVLTDRVARLLLRGTPSQRILCLTYTKAAASEMQNRLFQRLGEWAMLPNDQLAKALRELGEPIKDHDDLLPRARRLFARAIETPGGLKIQTIHAFCSALLRRFPLEASVSPDFTEVEERSLELLRRELLDQFAKGGEAEALQAVLDLFDEQGFVKLLADLGKFRDAFSGEMPDFSQLYELPKGFDEKALGALVFEGGEAKLFARVVPILANGTSTDQKLAAFLADFETVNVSQLSKLESKFLSGEKAKEPFAAKAHKLVTKGTLPLLDPGDLDALAALSERIEVAREYRKALWSMQATCALHRFARLWLPAFDLAKRQRGWLDFDDLVRLSRKLLGASSVAQWVLFKLDGGIDHILVDEAQDTSPEQWGVIDLLAQEFTAGAGARDELRTIFVVGDRKQSIYSFQGADLRGFDTQREMFSARLKGIDQSLYQRELKYSFRSSSAILRLVDQCFASDLSANGLGGTPEHVAFHERMAGRVDMWPVVPKPEAPIDQPWDDPLDRESVSDPEIVLADAIASEIRAMIERGEQIEDRDGPRAVHEGDFLILVRRRKTLFNALMRACKAQGLELAGADRLQLLQVLAIRDLISLLKFLSLPEDDLSLATVLRSPLFGWSEDALFRLAYGRGQAYLWETLRSNSAYAETLFVLDDLRSQTDFLRPYELIERVLTRHDGRRRIRARFGAEVDDALEAFVDLALSYEQGNVPTLDGFLVWLEASDAEVKRQSESAGRRIRVMTVHGAKGLEAPIVILPETMPPSEQLRDKATLAEDTAIVRMTKDSSTEVQMRADQATLEQRREESDRLLYVALTRAERWLIVAGAGELGNGESWYSRVQQGLTALGALELATPVGPGYRFSHGHWPAPAGPAGAVQGARDKRFAGLPELPPHPKKTVFRTPTGLGGAKAMPGEGDETDVALRRGNMIHALLERLPDWPNEDWRAPGQSQIAAMSDDPAEIDACLAEVSSLLAVPQIADLLRRPDGLAEISLSGEWDGAPLWGVIDRLIVEPERILAIDFKTNRVVPDDPSQVPEGLLRQMGAYAHLLRGVYPGRQIDTAILWTQSRTLQRLPATLVQAALERAALDPTDAAS